jgi:hypothetical protein
MIINLSLSNGSQAISWLRGPETQWSGGPWNYYTLIYFNKYIIVSKFLFVEHINWNSLCWKLSFLEASCSNSACEIDALSISIYAPVVL